MYDLEDNKERFNVQAHIATLGKIYNTIITCLFTVFLPKAQSAYSFLSSFVLTFQCGRGRFMITLFIDEEIEIEIKSFTQCCIVGVVEPTLEFRSSSSCHEVERL